MGADLTNRPATDLLWAVLGASLLIAGCSGGPDCASQRGVYPPETIVFESAEQVEAAFTAWGCPGYDAEGEDEIPTLPLSEDRQIQMRIPIRDGAELEVRGLSAAKEVPLKVDSTAENQTLVVPQGTTSLFVRACTDDGRCASYEVSVED